MRCKGTRKPENRENRENQKTRKPRKRENREMRPIALVSSAFSCFCGFRVFALFAFSRFSRFRGFPREPFGFENRSHTAQDLVFAFRSPNHFFEAIWCFHACRCEFSRFFILQDVNFHVFMFFTLQDVNFHVFTFFTLQGVNFHVFHAPGCEFSRFHVFHAPGCEFSRFSWSSKLQGVNSHVFRDFHAPRCEFPRFSRFSRRSKFFKRQPQKQKPYFGDPRNTGFAPEKCFHPWIHALANSVTLRYSRTRTAFAHFAVVTGVPLNIRP